MYGVVYTLGNIKVEVIMRFTSRILFIYDDVLCTYIYAWGFNAKCEQTGNATIDIFSIPLRITLQNWFLKKCIVIYSCVLKSYEKLHLNWMVNLQKLSELKEKHLNIIWILMMGTDGNVDLSLISMFQNKFESISQNQRN